MRDCAKKITELSGGKISYDAAKEILADVDSRAKKLISQGFDGNDAVMKVASERAAVSAEMFAKQKANVARNLVIKKRMDTAINDLVDAGLSPDKAMQALLEGIQSDIAGTKNSLAAQTNGLDQYILTPLMVKLFREGLVDLHNSRKFQNEIGEAMWQLSNGEKPTAGNKQTQRIAEIWHETIEQLRLQANEAGADINAAPGRTMTQRHDIRAMQKMGEDGWANFMVDLIDPNRSFDGATDMFDVLRGAYRAMVSGVRLNDQLQNAPELFQFTGPSNLAKKMSRSRQIVFKDYASWKKWNDTFGMRDLNDGLLDEARHMINNIALLEKFGTNPEAMMKEVWESARKRYRDKFGAEESSWKDSRVRQMMDYAMGKMNVPADPKLSRISAGIGAFENITRLGGALLSSLTDVPYKALEYQYQGKNILSSYGQAFVDNAFLFKTMDERIRYSSISGVYLERMIGDVSGRYSVNDDIGATAAKVNRLTFKLNGQTWWTDAHRQAMGDAMGHALGLEKNKMFAELDADTQRNFRLYDITPEDWEIARASAKTMEDGRDYVTSQTITNDKIARKFSTYFVDRVENGVLEPSARERRLVTLGTQAGTPEGVAMRAIGRFKAFPLTVVTKVWGRALYGKGKADIPALIQLGIVMTAFGYAVGALKDLVNGKTPKDPTRPETILAALAQGGGLGIFDSVLLSDTSGFGTSLAGATFGPTYGRVEDIYRIYSQAKKGEFAESRAVRSAVSYIPGNNWLPVKPILNHVMNTMVYEELNPGHMQRIEANINKTYGQKLWY